MQLFKDQDLAQPSRLAGNHAAMLAALADIGCGKDVLAALLPMFDDFNRDHIRFLTGPVIQHASSWAESTPVWVIAAVAGDRLRIILDEHRRGTVGWQVGPAELVAVMYPATMDAPMQYEYAQIYLWAAAQANARHRQQPVAEIWKTVGTPVEDAEIVDQGGRFHSLYRQLCSDIRCRVMKRAAALSSSPGPALARSGRGDRTASPVLTLVVPDSRPPVARPPALCAGGFSCAPDGKTSPSVSQEGPFLQSLAFCG